MQSNIAKRSGNSYTAWREVTPQHNKLVDRGTRMIQESLGLSYDEAQKRLLETGCVDKVLAEQ